MDDRIRQLEAQADRTRREARAADEALRGARSQCSHQWNDPKYNPIVTEGYQTKNYMGTFHMRADGTDDAPTVYVPRQESPRWTRTCKVCGATEHTERTTEHITKTPRF